MEIERRWSIPGHTNACDPTGKLPFPEARVGDPCFHQMHHLIITSVAQNAILESNQIQARKSIV